MMKYALALAAMIAAPAAAQENATERTVAPTMKETAEAETFAAALALLDIADLEQMVMATGMQSAQAAMEASLEAQRKRGVELPETLVGQLRQLVLTETRDMLREMLPTLRTESARVYAKYFTAEELRELKRMQELPVSKKMQKLLPQIIGDINKLGLQQSAERMPALQRKIEVMVAEWLKEQQVSGTIPEA